MISIKAKEEVLEAENFSELLEGIKDDFSRMLRVNPNIEPFSAKEKLARIKKREEIREALRLCSRGDEASKIFIKDHITRLLEGKYGINEGNISKYLKEDEEYKFRVMLMRNKIKYGKAGLEKLIDEKFLYCVLKGNTREISRRAINRAYSGYQGRKLNFPEKTELLTQLIYEKYKGNGPADELITFTVDGISGGVSGERDNFSVWIMYKGNSVRLSFLNYDGEEEIKRICRNLCKSYGMGQLSEKRGYLVAELSDGSRAAVARPPFCENWSFFIRKFRTERVLEIEDIVSGDGSENIIKIIEYLVKGERITAITGEQGSGKTTLLAAMVRFIPQRLNIRVEEMSFELHLRKRFPERNIVSFKETDGVCLQEGLDFTKKTDGNVTILGEAATMQSVIFLVQIAQNASSFTLFTHHAKDTDNLIYYMRNALLMKGNFNNERAAAFQAVRAVRFNIHVGKSADGKRYIEKISEIVPAENEKGFKESIIAIRKSKGYRLCEELDKETKEEIYKRISEEEKDEFIKLLKKWCKE